MAKSPPPTIGSALPLCHSVMEVPFSSYFKMAEKEKVGLEGLLRAGEAMCSLACPQEAF